MLSLRVALLLLFLAPCLSAAEPAPIRRLLPPAGIALEPAVEADLSARVAALRQRCDQLADQPLLPDAEIFVKAVELALEHREFYKPTDVQLARQQLDLAEERLSQLEQNKSPWRQAQGLVVRGYRSEIDDSAQPYGLEIPADLPAGKPVPLYVWLHGRGDKSTDLHFIQGRLTKAGQIHPQGAIVVHPFGRQCIGFKSAGEVDVLDVVAHVRQQYSIDPQRIVLMGFSMGGAGCWHLGAHYADHWVAMSPGAGFAETAQYTHLQPADYPPSYEQKLWGLYDVPDYVRNLLNLPVIAYSGEEDRQIQAAQVMEKAFASQGEKLTHLLGPGMGHRYHPDTLAEILRRIDTAVQTGLDPHPKQVHLQTRTLRYSQMFWVQALGLGEHWKDARIDAEYDDAGQLTLATQNITALRITLPAAKANGRILIDGQQLMAKRSAQDDLRLALQGDRWVDVSQTKEQPTLAKRPGLQGPIDDIFMEPFLVVLPTGKSHSAEIDAWVQAEVQHLQSRWRALFRGELPMKKDTDITDEDIAQRHLLLFGDPSSNQLIARLQDGLPITFTDDHLTVGQEQFSRGVHLPALIYPNPLNRSKYVVLNSGPTFREDHDRTNSLQNPKLPDWAILDLRQPPSGSAPARIAAAGFFDELWQWKPVSE
ncbi:alpha/beta hydrolase [Lignipirellula cremea]|uniref:Alpha/beta hydrolase family protein n=1 Tax=Lignipirellula cremea TaxID=2528010 RepID=A0A518DZV7_9BACT|nr:alpha/beta hydrolase [Lignipirellula cremea]QDU97376.1 Alpha/beta hydrolase family protein [Lignipirellula cremea]